MNRKRPGLLIWSGVALIILAGGLKAYDMVMDYSSGRNAQLLLEQAKSSIALSVSEETPSPLPETSGDGGGVVTLDVPKPDNPAPDNREHDALEPVNREPDALEPDDWEETSAPEETPAPAAQLNYNVAGFLLIPALELELPVLDEYSESLLNVSVCRYMGSAGDKPEGLVVAGHNYKSHFGNLSKLSVGDEVVFTSLSGTQHNYTVTEKTEINAYDHGALEQDDWDISLFTCTYDGSKRVLVRCRETQ